jgi:hypothetical protein
MNYRCDKIKEDEMGWACGSHGRRRIAYRIMVGKLEGRILLGRSGRG